MKTTLNGLYLAELADILSAENQLVAAFPRIINAVSSEELAAALNGHLQQTHSHIARLTAVFTLLGESTKPHTCEAMKGLLKEGDSAISDNKLGAVRDAALIGACQRMEHYEMAAYGTARAFAQTLGFEDQAEILGTNLEEEAAINEALTALAVSKVNPMARDTGLVGSGR